MNFNMKTPCPHCPFRTDVKPYITASRATEIIDAITRRDLTFACHKTVTYRDGEEGSEHTPSSDEEHCAGAAIFLESQGRANQMMRIAERLGMYDRKRLHMDAPIYPNARAMIAAHRRSR